MAWSHAFSFSAPATSALRPTFVQSAATRSRAMAQAPWHRVTTFATAARPRSINARLTDSGTTVAMVVHPQQPCQTLGIQHRRRTSGYLQRAAAGRAPGRGIRLRADHPRRRRGERLVVVLAGRSRDPSASGCGRQPQFVNFRHISRPHRPLTARAGVGHVQPAALPGPLDHRDA